MLILMDRGNRVMSWIIDQIDTCRETSVYRILETEYSNPVYQEEDPSDTIYVEFIGILSGDTRRKSIFTRYYKWDRVQFDLSYNIRKQLVDLIESKLSDPGIRVYPHDYETYRKSCGYGKIINGEIDHLYNLIRETFYLSSMLNNLESKINKDPRIWNSFV